MNCSSDKGMVSGSIFSSSPAPASGWQTTREFVGLPADTNHYVFARSRENANYNAGTAVASAAIRTDAIPAGGHTVTFNTNGGTHAEGVTFTQTVAHGAKAIRPADDPTRAGFTFTAWHINPPWDFDAAVEESITLTAQWTANARPPSGGGSSGSSSNSGGSSGSGGILGAITSLFTSANAPQNVTPQAARNAVNHAVQAAKSAGTSSATAKIQNPGEISLSALKSMANSAAQAGMEQLRLQADSMTANNRGVDVRITLDPALATTDLNLSASTSNAQATRTTNTFTRFFNNDVMTVSMGQQGSFGQTIRIAAKIVEGLNTDNLHFYAYDPVANKYTRIATPNYRIDANGFVHFDTSVGGNIVISDGPLVRR